MNVKKYYYYPPSHPQFFFPKKGFKKSMKYYTPYSLKSKIFWFVYSNFSLVREIFSIQESKIPLPVDKIKDILKIDKGTPFINLGSKGFEQTATIITLDQSPNKFLKFAQQEVSKKLVENETAILQQLVNVSNFITPRVFDFVKTENYSYVVTEVIEGIKMKSVILSREVLGLLIELGQERRTDLNEIQVFSHGDFCPWNILLTKDKKLVLIDWEMAGYKPLGYDLFTFMFQTSFLLKRESNSKNIIKENKALINEYFKTFTINDWKPYLIRFSKIKIREERIKDKSVLLLKYQELNNCYSRD